MPPRAYFSDRNLAKYVCANAGSLPTSGDICVVAPWGSTGGARYLAEYVEACSGNQKVSDVVLSDDTLYCVFENSHELPLLCYCCGEALKYPYLQNAQMVYSEEIFND
jgi:hypothetical protein